MKGFARKLLRPTVWITAEMAFAEAFLLALFALQARLLAPAAFGLVTAVTVFIALWEGIPARAIDEALISIPVVDEWHFSTVTTAGSLLAALFGAAIFAAARPLAAAFGSPELTVIVRVMAVLPLLNALSIAPAVAAKRNMQFQSLTLRTVVSLLAGGGVGMAMALGGWGVWSLVWQAIVQRLVAALVLWVAGPIPLRLGLSRRHLRELVVFAVPVTISRFMGWLSGQLPRLILGLHLGPTELGLFSIATRLDVIARNVAFGPKAMVARVDLRRFAADRAALAEAVQRVFLHLSMLSFPVCAGGIAVMPSLVHAWLDPRWYGAILPSQLMLIASAPHVTFYGSSALLYALNLQTWEAGIATVLAIGVVVGVAVAAPFGLVATTAAIAGVTLATLPLALFVIRRTCGLTLRDVLLPQAPAFVASCLMGGAVTLLRLHLDGVCSNATALVVEVVAGGGLYGVFVLCMSKVTLHRVWA